MNNYNIETKKLELRTKIEIVIFVFVAVISLTATIFYSNITQYIINLCASIVICIIPIIAFPITFNLKISKTWAEILKCSIFIFLTCIGCICIVEIPNFLDFIPNLMAQIFK